MPDNPPQRTLGGLKRKPSQILEATTLLASARQRPLHAEPKTPERTISVLGCFFLLILRASVLAGACAGFRWAAVVGWPSSGPLGS